jgi:hypothetical protein
MKEDGKWFLDEETLPKKKSPVKYYRIHRSKRGIVTRMADWIKFLHSFLELSKYPILQDKGRVSALEAKLKAEQEFEQYRVIQDKNYVSDFDKEIKRITGK